MMRLFCYALIFLATLWTCRKTGRASLVLRIVAVYSTGLALFGLYAFATGENFILGEDANRAIVQASFMNRNSYATYAAFGVLAPGRSTRLANSPSLAPPLTAERRRWLRPRSLS